MAYDKLLSRVDEELELRLSPKRRAHSRGVASFSAELCSRNGLDPRSGRLAGLAHDLCKELPIHEQNELFQAFLADRDDIELWIAEAGGHVIADEILHGPAAAHILRKEFSVEDKAVLDAVAFHTIGSPRMDTLSILVYCADKIEPGRKHVDDAFRRRCLSLEPRAMLLAVVADTLEWLAKKGRVVAPATLNLYNALRNSVNIL